MEPTLSRELIESLLQQQRNRPSYIVSVLEFQLGREPTQEEVDAVRRDHKLRDLAYNAWLKDQPWHIRKSHVGREQRLADVMVKRYNVPKELVKAFVNEIADWDD